jgi:hypothetical protein
MNRKLTLLLVLFIFSIVVLSCEELSDPQPVPDRKICEVEVFTVQSASSKVVHYQVITSGDLEVESVKYYSDNGFITIKYPTKFPMDLNFTLPYDLDSIGVFANAKVQNGKIEVKMSVTSSGSTVSQEDACSQYIN